MAFKINTWGEISSSYTGALLLGNGASISVSNKFSYSSLIEHAKENNVLAEDVKQLFDFFGTSDFELILRLVWQASNVNRSLNISDEKTQSACLRIRGSLIKSVRSIHPEHSQVDQYLPSIYGFIKKFKTILSLNYDLILYWAIAYGLNIEDGHEIKDCFISGKFDEEWDRLRETYRNKKASLVFYPHGSLVLYRDKVESEYKIKGKCNQYLLDTILDYWEQGNCIPIFVSEGMSEQKIKSIKSSYYLSAIYREVLSDLEQDLTIYGWGFGEQDIHVLKRMSKSNVQRVAISVYKSDQAFCSRVNQTVKDNLGTHVQVEFFDSESKNCWNNTAPIELPATLSPKKS